jgi:transposase InsO family protein
LRLKNERNGDVVQAIRSDNGSKFKNSNFETFFRDLGLEYQFCSPYVACQNGVVERKIVPFVRWLGRCSTSIGLREDIGQRRGILLAMLGTGFFSGPS